jgi:uncharacterized protein (DUF2147 family)
LYLLKRNKLIFLFTLLLAGFTPTVAQTQTILGFWATYDDVTGELKSEVNLYEKNGEIYGNITKLYLKPGDPKDPVCDECDEDDPRYKQKILGMEIIKGLKKDGDEYNGGNVLDPENGSVYKCRVWLEDGNLILRGYIGFSLFGRSQTWKRKN